MDDKDIEDLSIEEKRLVADFIEWVGEFDRQIFERQTIDGDPEHISIGEVFEFLAPLVSEDATGFDAQVFRLLRLRAEIQSDPVFEYEYEDELPSNPIITPDILNRFIKRDDLVEFFTISGQIIETLSIELLMEEVIASSRESKSTRKRIERMSQREREWLLYVTGVISDGEKGEIRRLYDLRNDLVHNSGDSNHHLKSIDLPNDLKRTMKTIDNLHKGLYGTELKHRFGDLVA